MGGLLESSVVGQAGLMSKQDSVFCHSRSWLVTELLCFSQQHEHASTDAEVLESFLAEKERLLGLPGVTAARHGLLEGTLDR